MNLRRSTAALVGGVLASSALLGVAAAPQASAATQAPIRVWSGDSSLTDSRGWVWAPSSGFTGGRNFTSPDPSTVVLPDVGSSAAAKDAPLFSTGRYGMTGWGATVANGTYRVELHFMDTWFANAGQRVFDVTAEGQTKLDNLDIARFVGQNVAYTRIFTVTVTDGHLDLGFSASVSQPTVSSIMVDPVPADPSGTPGPSNTGVPAGTTLTQATVPSNGLLVLNVAGKTYSNLDIHGRVRIMAPNITLKNSIIRGNDSTTVGSVIDVNYPGVDHTGFTLVDSTIAPEYLHWQQDGILGHDYTVLRSDISGTTDAVKIANSDGTAGNVTVQDSYLHDTTFWYGIGGSTNDTHNDGVQVVEGNNIVITHNTILRNGNSAMMVAPDAGPVTTLKFTGNSADDGGCVTNLAAKPENGYGTMGPITETSNRFGRHPRNLNCAIIVNTSQTTVTASGNTWADDGTAVALTRG